MKKKTLKIRISAELHWQLVEAYKALKRSKAKPAPATYLLAELLLAVEQALPRAEPEAAAQNVFPTA